MGLYYELAMEFTKLSHSLQNIENVPDLFAGTPRLASPLTLSCGSLVALAVTALSDGIACGAFKPCGKAGASSSELEVSSRSSMSLSSSPKAIALLLLPRCG